MTKQIIINEDCLERIGEKFHDAIDFTDIKDVVDYGDFYKINFYFPHKSQRFICQKDLLVCGTIEEFEELFADKIIRKVK